MLAQSECFCFLFVASNFLCSFYVICISRWLLLGCVGIPFFALFEFIFPCVKNAALAVDFLLSVFSFQFSVFLFLFWTNRNEDFKRSTMRTELSLRCLMREFTRCFSLFALQSFKCKQSYGEVQLSYLFACAQCPCLLHSPETANHKHSHVHVNILTNILNNFISKVSKTKLWSCIERNWVKRSACFIHSAILKSIFSVFI